MRITFVGYGNQQTGCGGACGPVMSLRDQIRQVIGGLQLAYRDQVEGEFIDLDGEGACEPIGLLCKEKQINLPALFIDGKLLMQGGIPLAAVKSYLDESGLEPFVIGKTDSESV